MDRGDDGCIHRGGESELPPEVDDVPVDEIDLGGPAALEVLSMEGLRSP